MKTKATKEIGLLLVLMLAVAMLGMYSITVFAAGGTPMEITGSVGKEWRNANDNEWYGMTPEDAQELYALVKSDFQTVTHKDLYNQLNPYVFLQILQIY